MAYPVAAPYTTYEHPSAFSKHRVLYAAVLSELRTAVDMIRRTRKARPAPPRSVFILDWDDTCCATSFLERSGCMADLDSRIDEFAPEEARLLRVLEARILSLLKTAVNLGTVLIITNAGDGWVEHSSSRFLPAVNAFLVKNYRNVAIISARARYVDAYRQYPLQWKALTFTDELTNIYRMEPLPTQPIHVIVLGDSVGDQFAAHIASKTLFSKGMPIILKVVKFLERPTIDQLCKELAVLLDHIDAMHAHRDGFDVSMYKEPVPVVPHSSQLQSHYQQQQHCPLKLPRSPTAVNHTSQPHYPQQQQHLLQQHSKNIPDQLSSQPSATISNSAVDTPITPVSAMATC